MTFMFLMVVLGATIAEGAARFAPLAIGLALTLIHLISIPVTNTSVNPARSTAVALFQGSWAVGQLWAFWRAVRGGNPGWSRSSLAGRTIRRASVPKCRRLPSTAAGRLMTARSGGQALVTRRPLIRISSTQQRSGEPDRARARRA